MITINIRYTGTNGSARAFADEMVASGTAAAIRAEEGNIRYEYYAPLDDPETILGEIEKCDTDNIYMITWMQKFQHLQEYVKKEGLENE